MRPAAPATSIIAVFVPECIRGILGRMRSSRLPPIFRDTWPDSDDSISRAHLFLKGCVIYRVVKVDARVGDVTNVTSITHSLSLPGYWAIHQTFQTRWKTHLMDLRRSCQHCYNHVRTRLDKCGPVWTSLDQSGPLGTSLNQSGQVWTSLEKSG